MRPPPDLSPAARAAWRRLVTDHPVILASNDPELVATFCECMAWFARVYERGFDDLAEEALLDVLDASRRLRSTVH
jgi:hypothetical protein